MVKWGESSKLKPQDKNGKHSEGQAALVGREAELV